MLPVTFILVIFYGNLLVSCQGQPEANNNLNTFDELGKTVAQLVRLRGYEANNHYVTTTDGYILNVVEVINPLLGRNCADNLGKAPVLFIHGTITNCKSFLIDSTGSRPIDYSQLNASVMSFNELQDLLGDDPTANCMPLLLSNFGHCVWILNRRGGYESQAHISPDTQPFANPLVNGEQALVGGISPLRSTNNDSIDIDDDNGSNGELNREKRAVNPEIYQPFTGLLSYLQNPPKINLTNVGNIVNPRYWNFSLDEQAKYDIPEVIDYILEQTNREKLSIISHSAGGTISLMSLINYPDLADKLSTSLLWSPSLYGDPIRYKIIAPFVLPELMAFLGPVPPASIAQLAQDLIAPICSNQLSASTICYGAVDAIFGFAGNQQKVYPGYLTAALDSFSAHDYVTILQTGLSGKQHKYDYYNAARNQLAYGQPSSPLYDVARIKARNLSFWVGTNDGLVPPESVRRIIADLRVPSRQNFIDQPGVLFNHISYFTHPNVSNLINIPGLQQLESNN